MEELVTLGLQMGLTNTEVTDALENETFSKMVRQDMLEAKQKGVRGVPFFLFNDDYALSGAQPVTVLSHALESSFANWQRHNPDTPPIAEASGQACSSQRAC